jgi:retron-type reverse transcriptase
VAQFEQNLVTELATLQSELCSGTYRHGSYEPFVVHDPKRRQIHKASVRDRVVHQAVVTAIEPLFERRFIFDSYSCRIGKGTHAGVARLRQMLRRESQNGTRRVYALKCDMRQYFASIDHGILLNLLAQRTGDEQVLWLLREILLSHGAATGRGIPLGNVTSQLFANVYLHELDWFVKQHLRVRHYLRYCDDIILVSADKNRLLAQVEPMGRFLSGQLGLGLHPNKTIVRTFDQGVDFLGYVVKPQTVLLRATTGRRMLARVTVRNLTSYLGVCEHASAYCMAQTVQTIAWQGCNDGSDKIQ